MSGPIMAHRSLLIAQSLQLELALEVAMPASHSGARVRKLEAQGPKLRAQGPRSRVSPEERRDDEWDRSGSIASLRMTRASLRMPEPQFGQGPCVRLPKRREHYGGQTTQPHGTVTANDSCVKQNKTG